MIPLREDVGQPDGGCPAQAESRAVAMRHKGAIDQRRQLQPAHLRHQERDVVHPLCHNAQGFVHTPSLPNLVIYRQK